jgi:hypothetical protein
MDQKLQSTLGYPLLSRKVVLISQISQETQTHGQKHTKCYPPEPRVRGGLADVPGLDGDGTKTGLDNDEKESRGAGRADKESYGCVVYVAILC